MIRNNLLCGQAIIAYLQVRPLPPSAPAARRPHVIYAFVLLPLMRLRPLSLSLSLRLHLPSLVGVLDWASHVSIAR